MFRDDFTQYTGWYREKGEEYGFEYLGDAYSIYVNIPDGHVWSVRSLEIEDVRLEVDASRIEGPEDGYFGLVCRYIDGNNKGREEIAMTAPVSRERRSEKIAMTAPVSQQASDDGWAVSFMMPAAYTMDSIPEPLDSEIIIREIPSYRAAVIRYSGFWSENNYQEHLEQLQQWIAAEGLQASGDAVWARYNAPFTPWFMRRNEILQRVLPDQP